jgi:hypothetical protein
MCDDVRELVAEMARKGVETGAVREERWGLLTKVTLPSGSPLGIYEPRHASPLERRAKSPKKRSAKRKAPSKKTARAAATKKAAKTKRRTGR